MDPVKQYIFRQKIESYEEQNRPIIYIDESGFAHDMPRTHGYALKGKRCYGTQDWGAKGRTNAIGALLGKALLTVSLFCSNIDTTVFTAWVEQDLLPKLPPKSVIVLDNAAFHKGKDMMKTIEKNGHTLEYLPPYSPQLNPIEQKWAQAKSIRRKHRCGIEMLFKKYIQFIES